MMKFDLVFLALCALLYSVSSHSSVVVSPVVQGYSAGMYKGPATVAANTGFAAEGIINVGGRAATAPASMRIAANAPRYAAAAVRLNPALAVGAIGLWLLDQGLEYVNGSWQKKPQGWEQWPQPIQDDCASRCTIGTDCYNAHAQIQLAVGLWAANPTYLVCGWYHPQYGLVLANNYGPQTPLELAPATDADWDAVTAPLSDAAADQFADTNPLPVEQPEFAPSDIPVGDPYTKPDGSTVQPRAKISPAGPGKVTVDIYEKPLTNPDGSPAAADAPITDTPEPEKDPCEDHPDRVGCVDLGTVDDMELQTQQHSPISITPVSVGGAGSCPAPLTGSFLGKPIAFKFDYACTAANMLRPLILALAWLSAGIIFIGGVRNG